MMLSSAKSKLVAMKVKLTPPDDLLQRVTTVLQKNSKLNTAAMLSGVNMVEQRQPMIFNVMKRGFYYPDAQHHHLNQEPHVLAKRIIKVVGERLRHMDPNRWDGVPITFKTHWNSENDQIDIKTCILIHDALEREFSIDIDDRKILMQSVQDCFHFMMSVHTAV